MKQEEKGQIIEEIRSIMAGSKVAIVTHYRGLTVAELTDLRRKMRQAGAEYRVVKNTLAKRAAKGTGFENLEGLLSGPTGLATSKDPVAPAKVLAEFAKGNPKLVLLGGVLDGKMLTPEGIQELAKLPSREVLLAQLMGVMNGPIRGFVTVLSQVPASFVRVLDQIRQHKEDQAA